jgi:hypothetical protein
VKFAAIRQGRQANSSFGDGAQRRTARLPERVQLIFQRIPFHYWQNGKRKASSAGKKAIFPHSESRSGKIHSCGESPASCDKLMPAAKFKRRNRQEFPDREEVRGMNQQGGVRSFAFGLPERFTIVLVIAIGSYIYIIRSR